MGGGVYFQRFGFLRREPFVKRRFYNLLHYRNLAIPIRIISPLNEHLLIRIAGASFKLNLPILHLISTWKGSLSH